MNLNAKYLIVAILSILIVIVLGMVVAAEKRYEIETRHVIVSNASAGCIKCHKSDFEGGPGRDPGIAHHWEASAHATHGIGCYECHGLPDAGTIDDLDNPRYVV